VHSDFQVCHPTDTPAQARLPEKHGEGAIVGSMPIKRHAETGVVLSLKPLDQPGVDQETIEPAGLGAARTTVEQALAAIENTPLLGK
jgi:hypothetical protein